MEAFEGWGGSFSAMIYYVLLDIYGISRVCMADYLCLLFPGD